VLVPLCPDKGVTFDIVTLFSDGKNDHNDGIVGKFDVVWVNRVVIIRKIDT
jgi:hypothetical protein